MTLTINEYCKSWRRENKITGKEVAEKSGYSLWNVYAYEAGRNDNVRILLAYIALGLSLDQQNVEYFL